MLIWHAMTHISNTPKNMATPVQLFFKEMQQWHLLQRHMIIELYTPPWKPVT